MDRSLREPITPPFYCRLCVQIHVYLPDSTQQGLQIQLPSSLQDPRIWRRKFYGDQVFYDVMLCVVIGSMVFCAAVCCAVQRCCPHPRPPTLPKPCYINHIHADRQLARPPHLQVSKRRRLTPPGLYGRSCSISLLDAVRFAGQCRACPFKGCCLCSWRSGLLRTAQRRLELPSR
jgi:hypothetical protein